MRNSLFEVFTTVLRDLFDVENQLIALLPKMIKESLHPELKSALTTHLNETQNQKKRLQFILESLNANTSESICKSMRELINEVEEIITRFPTPSSLKDVYLIILCQKIKHYEIASYGSARALARHLSNFSTEQIDFKEIADTLQYSLDEETRFDETLIDLAEGGFFSRGINDEAELESTQ